MSAAAHPPPTGLAYIAVIKPALHDILIAHTFTTVLVPLLFCLFFFSKVHTRRQPIFVLNVVTITFALAVGVLIDVRAVRTIIAPTHPMPLSVNIAIGIMGAIQSILVDTILLLRLTSVYPRHSVGNKRFFAMISLPVLIKLARLVNLIMFIVVLAEEINDPVKIAIVWAKKPYLKIEWVLQVVDNTYASVIFLVRLYTRRQRLSPSGMVDSTSTSSTFAARLQMLFTIALTNFLVPTLFSIAQLAIVYLPTGTVDVATINDIVLVNTSLAVIGVVFATVWAGSVHSDWVRDARSASRSASGSKPSDGQGQNQALSALAFASNPGAAEKSGATHGVRTFRDEEDGIVLHMRRDDSRSSEQPRSGKTPFFKMTFEERSVDSAVTEMEFCYPR